MQEPTPSPARYHGAAIALHWVLAGLLVYQFALGLRLDELKGSDKFVAFQLHKSVGITVLLLSLARLALRLFVRRPAEVGEGLQRMAARLVHWGFYAVMILTPLTGWIIVSTAKIKLPTLLFGAVNWPHLPLGPGFNEPAEAAHTVLAWALPALIVLHVGAVLYHWRLRDEVPGRMLAAGLTPLTGIGAGIVWLVASAGAGIAGPLPNLWAVSPAPPPPTVPALPEPAASDATETASAEPVATDAEAVAQVAPSCDWELQPGSRLGFATQYGGAPINGTFKSWQSRIHFCEDDPAHASVRATINLVSASTGDAERDENLAGASFFDTAKFAQAHFSTSGFKQLGPGRYATNGTLSLHGASKPVRLVFTLKVNGDAANAQGSTSLSRLSFGVGSDEWTAIDQIPDAVAVQFTIHARRAN